MDMDEAAERGVAGIRRSGRSVHPHTSFYAPRDLIKRLGEVAKTLDITLSELLERAARRALMEYPPTKDLPDERRLEDKVATAEAWLGVVDAERAKAAGAVSAAKAAHDDFLQREREKHGWRKGDSASAKIFGDALVLAALDVLHRKGTALSAAQIVPLLPRAIRERFDKAGHPLAGPAVDAVLRERAERGKLVVKKDGLYSSIDKRKDPRAALPCMPPE